jgi:hypothetical protein
MGRPVSTPWKTDNWHDQLLALRGHVLPELPRSLQALDAQNLQNCLCEVDKYLRAKSGVGRPRQNFKPSTALYK